MNNNDIAVLIQLSHDLGGMSKLGDFPSLDDKKDCLLHCQRINTIISRIRSICTRNGSDCPDFLDIMKKNVDEITASLK